jgi:lysophospholipase L1-like esterase
MKRAIPWAIAIVAVIAAGASFSEIQRMRGRLGEATRHQFHDHRDVRQFMIAAALVGLDQPIVVIGDSITEMARLPETIDGRPVVNAGIGGASIEDFQTLAPILMQNSKPSLIVVALGTNDGTSIQPQYAALLSKLKTFSARLLAVGVTPQDGADMKNAQIRAAAESESVQFVEASLPDRSTLPDRIHLNATGYRAWIPAIAAAIVGVPQKPQPAGARKDPP